VANVWINGELFGEIGLNAGVSGHFGVPVIMISGDKAACAEAAALLGTIETVVVKVASGRMAAECLPLRSLKKKSRLGQDGSHTAEKRGGKFPAAHPAPISLAIDFVQSEMADRAAILPGARRSGRRLEYTAQDMPTIYAAFRTALSLARG